MIEKPGVVSKEMQGVATEERPPRETQHASAYHDVAPEGAGEEPLVGDESRARRAALEGRGQDRAERLRTDERQGESFARDGVRVPRGVADEDEAVGNWRACGLGERSCAAGSRVGCRVREPSPPRLRRGD